MIRALGAVAAAHAWRRIALAVLVLTAATIAAALLAASAAWAEGDAASYALTPEEQQAYIERAQANLQHLLERFEFIATSNCATTREPDQRCQELYGNLKAGDFEFIPPIEWSDDDPNLPTYTAMLGACPGLKPQLHLTEDDWLEFVAQRNFGSYELSHGQGESEEQSVYAFRSEDYAGPINEDYLGPRDIVRQYVVFTTYDFATCKKLEWTLFTKYDSYNVQDPWPYEYLGEIVRMEGRFFILNIFPLGKFEEDPSRYMRFNDLGPDGRSGKDSYSLTGARRPN